MLEFHSAFKIPYLTDFDRSSSSVQVFDAETSALVSEIQLRTVIDISFSPLGSQIQTWERHGKFYI